MFQIKIDSVTQNYAWMQYTYVLKFTNWKNNEGGRSLQLEAGKKEGRNYSFCQIMHFQMHKRNWLLIIKNPQNTLDLPFFFKKKEIKGI